MASLTASEMHSRMSSKLSYLCPGNQALILNVTCTCREVAEHRQSYRHQEDQTRNIVSGMQSGQVQIQGSSLAAGPEFQMTQAFNFSK